MMLWLLWLLIVLLSLAVAIRFFLLLVSAKKNIDRLNEIIMDAKTGQFWYWDDNNLDTAFDEIHDAVDGRDVGEVVTLRPLHEMPKIFVVVKKSDHLVFDSMEDADEAADTMEEK